MKVINVKKGFDLKITGVPSNTMQPLDKPSHVAVLPEKIPFVKPRLKIAVGDDVKIGTPLFEDKRNPDIKFLSPGAGEITRIDFGPRRVIEQIVILLADDEPYEAFNPIGAHEVDHLDRDTLVKALLKGGLWPFVRTLPFRDIADPKIIPPAIFVSLDTLEPFHPQPEVYLQGAIELFRFGLRLLERLGPRVYVTASQANTSIQTMLDGEITHVYRGAYPAHDPGVLLYHIKREPQENAAAYLNGQDVLHIARFFKQGRYPIDRVVTLGGSSVAERKHFLTRAGVPLKHLAHGNDFQGPQRYIIGGIFNGRHGHPDGYMGFYENALNVLPVPEEPEFLAFSKPGFDKLSHSRTFLSSLRATVLDGDCSTHGEERACVNCGYCADVCPVDILPQFTLKALLVDEIEEALAHGLLDCVECGLCSYVCPSKIELADTLTKFKASYSKER